MYIGARYVPIFADPVEWDDEREYEPLTIVIHDGSCYTSKCYVPKGAQLPPYPEGQTKYWVKTSDYNYQFADLKKTVTDLSRLVEQFQKDNERFTELINGWNEKVIQWEKDMTAWGERLDTVESNVADLTARLNAEIDRAKAAEQANAAAIAQETADRKQAISDLDTAYKAADAAEAQARAEADTALSNRITTNKTDIDAIKAEQVIQNTNISNNAKNIADNSAEIAKHATRLTSLESNASDWDDAFPDTTIAQEVQKEEAARAEADTALSNRITTNKTDIDAIKAEQVIQNTNISNNAKNIADNSAEIAKHATRLTSLESNASDWDDAFPDTTIAQEVQKEEAARANADTALNGRCDTIAADVEEVRDIANHKVDQTVFQTADNLNVKYISPDKKYINTQKLAATGGTFSHNSYLLANNRDPFSWGFITAQEIALKSEVDTAQAAADKANTSIGDWETDHPGQTISQCATSVENEIAAVDAKADANAANIGNWNAEHPGKTISQAVTDVSSAIPDVSGFVTETTYNQGQAAQDSKITAAQTAADKANTNIGDWETEHPGQTISQNATSQNARIAALEGAPGPDLSGYVTKSTYTEEQTAQDAKIAAAQTAADKANTNIGDWETEHPGQTISQNATSQNARIAALEGAPGPDLSGYVTKSTYTEEQTAQDAKIAAAQTAADKANTNIGDWETEHPGQTIAQIDVRTYLDELYPENSVIKGTRLVGLYTQHYQSETVENVIQIPILAPYIVTAFPELWTLTFNAPTSVTMYNAAGVAQTKNVTKYEINTTGNESVLFVTLANPFDISAAGIYYFKLNPDRNFISYHWDKNNIKFALHSLPGDDT
jgi:hypothetical protein